MLTIRCLTPLRRTVLCLTLLKHNYILPHSCTTVLCLTLLKRIVLRWAAYCCRLPAVPATSSPHAESHKPRFPQISQPYFPSHSSSQPFNTWNLWQALAQASYERGRVIREDNLSVCKTSGMRRWRVERLIQFSVFPDWGELGTLILFVHLHWDSGRFMLMNAPDSTIWPLQGNSRSTIEAQFPHLASRTIFAIRKRKIGKLIFLPWKLFQWWNLTLSVVFKITQNDRNHWTFTWTFHFLTCDIDLEVSGKNTCLALKCNSWSVSRLPGPLAGTTWCPTWLFATEFGLPSEQPVLFCIKDTYKLESKAI